MVGLPGVPGRRGEQGPIGPAGAPGKDSCKFITTASEIIPAMLSSMSKEVMASTMEGE